MLRTILPILAVVVAAITFAALDVPGVSGDDADYVRDVVIGDVDCDGDVDPVDALKIQRYDAGLSVSQNNPCPNLGNTHGWEYDCPGPGVRCHTPGENEYGDVNCDDDVNPVDALKILRYDAGLGGGYCLEVNGTGFIVTIGENAERWPTAEWLNTVWCPPGPCVP